MRSLVKARAGEGIWLQEMPAPEPGPNDLIIRVRKTAICGTDLHIYRWDEWAAATIPVPMIVGHEYCGVIEQMGSAVQGFSVGDRVSGEGHVTCGHCRNCRAGKRHLCPRTVGVGVDRPGAFAEYLCLPAFNAFRLPEAIDDEVASILDPLGNAIHTALSFNLVGEDVLITGAGPIGCMAVAIARYCGARHVVVTDLNPYRLEMARELGASVAVDVRERSIRDAMDELGMLGGFDVGLEMSGSPRAFQDMLDAMLHGGRIALLGIPPGDMTLDWNAVIMKGLMIKGIYGREMFETWYKMGAMLQSGLDVSAVITHRFPASEFQRGFDTMIEGRCGKIVLDWT